MIAEKIGGCLIRKITRISFCLAQQPSKYTCCPELFQNSSQIPPIVGRSKVGFLDLWFLCEGLKVGMEPICEGPLEVGDGARMVDRFCTPAKSICFWETSCNACCWVLVVDILYISSELCAIWSHNFQLPVRQDFGYPEVRKKPGMEFIRSHVILDEHWISCTEFSFGCFFEEWRVCSSGQLDIVCCQCPAPCQLIQGE